MKKRILFIREHYDFEDLRGSQLGSAEANFLQVPPKFVVADNQGQELMRLEGKMVSLRNEFTFYDNKGVELGTIRKKIIKLIGEEYWVEKMGLNSCAFMETLLNTITEWKPTGFQWLLSTRNGCHYAIK